MRKLAVSTTSSATIHSIASIARTWRASLLALQLAHVALLAGAVTTIHTAFDPIYTPFLGALPTLDTIIPAPIATVCSVFSAIHTTFDTIFAPI
jgi:hypothetical protein